MSENVPELDVIVYGAALRYTTPAAGRSAVIKRS